MTDQDLLRAYVETSDRDSLGAFLERYQNSLMRFVGKLLGDADAAQDVVQETFLEVARHPRRLLDVDSCHNWLLRVARNIGIDRIRRDARARKHTEAFGQTAAGAVVEAPSRAMEAEEVRGVVRAAIAGLSARHRELLLLKVQEEKSYREIAEITGLTVTNVGYILHHAMKKLAANLNHARGELS